MYALKHNFSSIIFILGMSTKNETINSLKFTSGPIQNKCLKLAYISCCISLNVLIAQYRMAYFLLLAEVIHMNKER